MNKDKFLTPKEVAYRFQCSYKTVINLIKDKKLSSYKIGRHFKILESDIQQFLFDNKVGGDERN